MLESLIPVLGEVDGAYANRAAPLALLRTYFVWGLGTALHPLHKATVGSAACTLQLWWSVCFVPTLRLKNGR